MCDVVGFVLVVGMLCVSVCVWSNVCVSCVSYCVVMCVFRVLVVCVCACVCLLGVFESLI